MKVFWNTGLPNPRKGKPPLRNAKGDEELDIAQVCSVQRHLNRLEREEQEEGLKFIASVKPETAVTILGTGEGGISVIFKVRKIAGGGNVD
jgi:hypothetical protein